ncbi:MAG: di-heme oxidoredictase family protein [Myxococcota bacterium]
MKVRPSSPRVAPSFRLAATLLFSCGLACQRSSAPPVDPSELRPGGGTTVSVRPRPSFKKPAASLSSAQKPDFYAGRALAQQPWVRAPSSTDARDGLGPLYNARSCLGCHADGGRGAVAAQDGPTSLATVVRLSIPGAPSGAAPRPEPRYGTQLQIQSTDLMHQLRMVPGLSGAGQIPPEAEAGLRWQRTPFRYPDGTTVELRRPELEVSNWAYGTPEPTLLTGIRATPPLHGMGLLEAIPEEAIRALADPKDADGDGISGRPNQVNHPVSGEREMGRFGLKANQSTLRNQVAAALRDDMGITNPVFPEESCTSVQAGCAAAPHGKGPEGVEISNALLDLLLEFVESIGVPERRKPEHPMVLEGRRIFMEVGCQGCHTPSFRTAMRPEEPHLSEQRIWPYTDLLLHDMGKELADGRPDHEASGQEWRTPPLWATGLARSVGTEVGFLHDGRARTVEEAVLWHGGEASRVRDRFLNLEAKKRRALLAFVKSL